MSIKLLRFLIFVALWANLWAAFDSQNWYAAGFIIVLINVYSMLNEAEDHRDRALELLSKAIGLGLDRNTQK